MIADSLLPLWEVYFLGTALYYVRLQHGVQIFRFDLNKSKDLNSAIKWQYLTHATSRVTQPTLVALILWPDVLVP